MSQKLKCHQNANFTKMQMSPVYKWHQNAYAPKSPKCRCHQNKNGTQTQMSPKCKCHQNINVTKNTNIIKKKNWKLNNWNITKHKCHQNQWLIMEDGWCQNANVTETQMSPKLKCPQNTNVTKTQISPKRKYHQNDKCHHNVNFTKTQISPNYQRH